MLYKYTHHSVWWNIHVHVGPCLITVVHTYTSAYACMCRARSLAYAYTHVCIRLHCLHLYNVSSRVAYGIIAFLNRKLIQRTMVSCVAMNSGGKCYTVYTELQSSTLAFGWFDARYSVTCTLYKYHTPHTFTTHTNTCTSTHEWRMKAKSVYKRWLDYGEVKKIYKMADMCIFVSEQQ